MTDSEAIKILQRDLQIQLENKALPDGIEAIQIAIQALEKQIPMKPKINRIEPNIQTRDNDKLLTKFTPGPVKLE